MQTQQPPANLNEEPALAPSTKPPRTRKPAAPKPAAAPEADATPATKPKAVRPRKPKAAAVVVSAAGMSAATAIAQAFDIPPVLVGQPAQVGSNQLEAAAAGATSETEAAAVVADLKALQQGQPRMVAIINQGGLGRKIALYLQERGVAAVALVGEAPAHLADGIHKLSPLQLAALAPEVPQGQALLEATRKEVAKAGIRAALQQLPGQMRTHPAQVKHDAKKARKAAAKQLQLQRTQEGQRRARAALTQQQDLQAISNAYAEAGLVVPVGPVVVRIGGQVVPVATITTGAE